MKGNRRRFLGRPAQSVLELNYKYYTLITFVELSCPVLLFIVRDSVLY